MCRTLAGVGDQHIAERILIIEDDDRIAEGLVRAFEANGYLPERAATGLAGIERAGTEPIVDLVILDLGLPDIDGIAVCRSLHAASATLPVIVLTARREEIDIVIGLDAGAVDYISKPFRLAELLARVRAQLRRPPAAVESELAATQNSPAPIVIGDVSVDRSARRVRVAGAEVALRAKEFDLLAVLVANAGAVMSRERLMSDVWDEHWFGSTKTLDVHIAALRRRLGEEPGQPSRITTLRAVGYRFELLEPAYRVGPVASSRP